MRTARADWQDPELASPLADEPAPLPRAALLPLAAALVIVVITALEHPAGWLTGMETAVVITMPLAAALTLMFGSWNLSGPSRRHWNWAARRQRRRRALRPHDLRIVQAHGRVAQISGELVVVAGSTVIPTRPGSPPLPPPGAYHLRWRESAQAGGDPLLLSIHPAQRGFPAGERWLALAGALLFAAGTACMLILFRHVFPVTDGGQFALAFYFLLMTAMLAVPAGLLAAEWRYLRRRDSSQTDAVP